MAAPGGKALVLAMLISFLAVQGELGVAGTFGRCYCNAYRDCKLNHHGDGTCIQAAHWSCIKEFKWLCPKHHVGPATDEDTMTVAAGDADHGEFNITEGSTAAPAGGADHGKFIVAEEYAAP